MDKETVNIINHAERKHALLSASSASRWLHCTPSAKMSENIPEEKSIHADEGTLAHEYAENILRYKLGFIDEVAYNGTWRELKNHELYTTDLDDEIQPYIDLVLEQVAEARAIDNDALILIEQKVSLEEYIPEGIGTCDFIIIVGNMMWIIDLKFGKGVRVTAVENSQLKLYALGALLEFGILYDIKEVKLIISQPRLDAVSVFDILTDELLQWADDVVLPKAKEAFKGEGEHVIGEWCKFCKAKPLCPAFRNEALKLAELDFAPPDPPCPNCEEQNLLEIYMQADGIIDYLTAVKGYILNSALSGKKWEGLKIVESTTNRSIKDEEKAMKILAKAGYDEIMYVNRTVKLKGLGDLAKNIGMKNRDVLLGELMVKPQGKPVLVLETDSRPEYSSAEDFK